MNPPKARYCVVAGIFYESGRVLMGKRHESEGRFAGYWEFPGGKIEEGEDDFVALKREFMEELKAEIEILDHFKTLNWEYHDRIVELRFYFVRLLAALSSPHEWSAHSELRWFSISEASQEQVLPANQEILKALAHSAPATKSDIQF